MKYALVPLLLLLAPLAGAQPFDADSIEAVRLEAIRHVEEATGHRFARPPELVLADDLRLVEVLRAEKKKDPLFAAYGPEAVEAILAAMAARVIAFYSMDEEKTFLSPSHLQAEYELLFEPGRETRYLLLIVFHELVHALDDQVHDVGSICAAMDQDGDRWQAYQSVIEGHAFHLEDALAAKLGLADIFEKRLAHVAHPGGEGLPSFILESMAQGMLFPYLEGRAFFRQAIEREGPGVVDRLFRQPPGSTTEILDPERYFSPSPEPEELGRFDGLLALVEERLGGEGWDSKRDAYGAKTLYFGLIQLGEEERRAIVRRFRGGKETMIRSTSEPLAKIRFAQISVHADHEAARVMVEASRVLEAKKDETAKDIPLLRIEESTESPIALGAVAGYSRLRRYRVLAFDQRTWYVGVACGRVVLELGIANDEGAEKETKILLERFAEEFAR